MRKSSPSCVSAGKKHKYRQLEKTYDSGVRTKCVCIHCGCVRRKFESNNRAIPSYCFWDDEPFVQRDTDTVYRLTTLPVLFSVSQGRFPSLVQEVKQSGNDKLYYRSISTGQSDRVLVKVVAPTHHTLLRATEKVNGDDIVAYYEQAPHIWVEAGYRLSVVPKFDLGRDKCVLFRPPFSHAVISAEDFTSVCDSTVFQLSSCDVAYRDVPYTERIDMSVQLASDERRTAEFWVIQENAMDVFQKFVAETAASVLSTLLFAVVTCGEDPPVVALRTKQTVANPEILAIEGATAFCRYQKFDNLFVANGLRIHPLLRRDVIRKLFSADDDSVVWLIPDASGSFVPHRCPVSAFRPASDWVEYLAENQREVLEAQTIAQAFAFDSFACPAEEQSTPVPARSFSTTPACSAPTFVPPKDRALARRVVKEKLPSKFEHENKLPLEDVRAQLEIQFVRQDGALDCAERIELWSRLAHAYDQLVASATLLDVRSMYVNQANLAWINVLWHQKGIDPNSVVAWRTSRGLSAYAGLEELDALLALSHADTASLCIFSLAVLSIALQPDLASALQARIPKIKQFLTQHSSYMSVKLYWLVMYRLCCTTSDQLGLVQERDFVVSNFAKTGLRINLELPLFLRSLRLLDGEMRNVVENLRRVFDAVRTWASNEPINDPYADVTLAFGLAKLGERQQASALVEQGRVKFASVKKDKTVLQGLAWVADAYAERVDRVIRTGTYVGSVSKELLDGLNDLDKGPSNSLSAVKYPLERLLDVSFFLESDKKLDPYLRWAGAASSLNKELLLLQDSQDADVKTRYLRLLDAASCSSKVEDKVRILSQACKQALRFDAAFATKLLEEVTVTLDRCSVLLVSNTATTGVFVHEEIARMVNQAVILAGHWGQPDTVRNLFAGFLRLLAEQKDSDKVVLVNQVSRGLLRSLRKFGLNVEIDLFLTQVTDQLLGGMTLSRCKKEKAAKWVDTLRALLHLAEAWIARGNYAQAEPTLVEARDFFFNEAEKLRLPQPKLVPLLEAYIAAVAQGEVQEAVRCIIELFTKLKPIPSSYSTSDYYSRSHVNLFEEVVRVLTSDNFTEDSLVRRFADEEEYLIRKKIHQQAFTQF